MAVKLNTLSVEALEAELRHFEGIYGVPSSRLAEAFLVDGELNETEDYLEWSFAFANWRLFTEQGRVSAPGVRRRS